MISAKFDLRIEENADAVARAAADLFTDEVNKAHAEGRDLTVALSGGSTPKLLYNLLASPEYRDRIPWGSIKFFFGDERWVPPTDNESNYKLANDDLFTKVPVDRNKIFPIPTVDISPEEAASQYAETILREFGLSELRQIAQFDLIFLGMGDDGHTASCFPNTPALHEDMTCTSANFVPKFGTYRITLTPPVLQRGRLVVFMVAGSSKAPALHEVLEGELNTDMYPSQLLRAATGKVVWLVDKEAAALLEGQKTQA